MPLTGQLAALGTAVCWALGSNLFGAAVPSLGSRVLNRLRLGVALLVLLAIALLRHGAQWPQGLGATALGLLALSGLVGFTFGDAWGFRSIALLGPGRASLLGATWPVFTTALAWPLLHQRPGPHALLGMSLTVGGNALVFLGGSPTSEARPHREGSAASGVLAGLLGALGQAGGYVIARPAMAMRLHPLDATLVRLAAGAAGAWVLALFAREGRRTLAALRDRRATAFLVAGALAGPVTGVTLSLLALQYIDAGVAASITACSPILALLIAWRFHGERLSWRVSAGALVAVAGVVVLFQR